MNELERENEAVFLDSKSPVCVISSSKADGIAVDLSPII